MAKPQAVESNIGHNSESRIEAIQELAVKYAKTHEESQKLNDERAKIRATIKDMDLDTKAWQDQITRALQDLKKRDGYDKSAEEISEALGQMDMAQLWKHVFEREERKNAERQAKKEAKEKEKADKPKKNPRTGMAAVN